MVNDGRIFLLSKEDYQKYKDVIPPITCYWWLSSQGYSDEYACEVVSQEFVNYFCNINNNQIGVRPAYLTLEYSDSSICLGGVTWIRIDDDVVFEGQSYCLYITEVPIDFRKFDESSNIYQGSSVRDYLENWQQNRMQEG